MALPGQDCVLVLVLFFVWRTGLAAKYSGKQLLLLMFRLSMSARAALEHNVFLLMPYFFMASSIAI